MSATKSMHTLHHWREYGAEKSVKIVKITPAVIDRVVSRREGQWLNRIVAKAPRECWVKNEVA